MALALSTLAQGDLDAAEFGQAAHVALLSRAGILRQEEIITMRGRFPRTRASYTSGAIIDDHCSVELEPAASFGAPWTSHTAEGQLGLLAGSLRRGGPRLC